MHFAKVVRLFILSSSSSLVAAENCYGSYDWCGWSLIQRGNYESYIKQKLSAAGKPLDDFTVTNSLFHCHGDNSGEADYVGTCGKGCVYGGASNTNDKCV